MNPIIPAMALKKIAEFGARVVMELYISWHGEASHKRAERYRVRLAEIEMKRRQQNEK